MDRIRQLLIEINERTDDEIVKSITRSINIEIDHEQEKDFGQRMVELYQDFDFDYQEWVCFNAHEFGKLMEYAQIMLSFRNDPLVHLL